MVTCKRQNGIVAIVCDEETAGVLLRITRMIGGDPAICTRKNMDDLRYALESIRVSEYRGYASGCINLHPGGITRYE